VSTERAPDSSLIRLRDRCGLLAPEQAWQVLQRITWVRPTSDIVDVLNTSIDDVEDKE
jgi:hypothetical protein